ncbi:P-loop containing nucleoside triphosphate hydrolase protein [Massarina eburnea CBS 473.64]|uniref:P-loop containing nucleoside triphosphate hydrolase protein n=1 Tax=Massarina eburnea CBS 473.64 TaxID=1395130 RepID=A0A6A6RP98_9PLEO|nr:P-loop containing nucleoside triphosphate hydrolase protein [Massarina eburnea CBS 473.64]
MPASESGLRQMSPVSSTAESVEAAPKQDMAPLGSLPSIHSVYEDPQVKGRWTTNFPTRAEPPAEDAVSAQHALVARYKLSVSPTKTLDLQSIVVQSPLLKESLGRVLKDYAGVTTELERLEFNQPFESFVHRWEELETEISVQAKKDLDDPSNAIHLTHLQLLHSTLETELSPILREKKDLIANDVARFNKLWTIFEPDCLVYHKVDDHDRVYRLKTAKIDSCSGTRVFKLDCQFVDYDGTNFGFNKQTINITDFRGTKKINKLEALPLDFHADCEGVKERLTQRGRMFETLKGYHFVGYDGIGVTKVHRGEQKFNVQSRIIIDAYSFSRYKTKTNLEYFEVEEEEYHDATSSVNGEDPDEDCVLLDQNGSEAKTSVGKKPVLRDTSSFVLTPEQHLLADSKVRGYSLGDKRWFQFFIDSIKDIEWNESAFASLVAPQEQKDLILSFAESQAKNGGSFDDFIQGKGKGIIMLLAGPPGVGKTLTAESVAESMKAPLYSIGAADLGSKPMDLEKKLHDILEICSKWNAVLLLDEADVFMEARNTANLERNKLVAIFLRLLEYFSGILFLTTNRLENMDAAFESRIHLTLNYSELDKTSRKHIWSTFLNMNTGDTAREEAGFVDADLEKLSKERLNGRQIKNVVKMAGLLAGSAKERLGMRHLETVLRLRKQGERKSLGFFGEGTASRTR